MEMSNPEIAARLRRLADLVEIDGDNPFRIRAYRNAADTIDGLTRPVTELVAADVDLTDYPHIGRDIAAALRELVATGSLPPLVEVEARVPPELADLMRVRGLGPKGVKALHEHLRPASIAELERLARAGRTRELPGFGAKKEAALLAGIRALRTATPGRTRRADAAAAAEAVRDHLAAVDGVEQVVIAGSYRRRCETIGDLDLVVASHDGDAVTAALAAWPQVDRVLASGPTRTTVMLANGLQLDLRVVAPAHFGAALLYFTGSQAHNTALRQLASDQGRKLNEYGLLADGESVASREEAEIHAALGLAWIPPELREGRGEIEAAAAGRLPELVENRAIRGNLHGHTTWSDGHDSLDTMVAAARERGYEYLAITDHGPALRFANGLSVERLREQIERVAAVDAAHDDVEVLTGCEVDILADGALGLPDEVLAELDIVVCSIHYQLERSREEQTQRVLRAMESPYFMIWGHPTARTINRREPIAIDLDRCLRRAAELGIAVEINAQPKRLDLSAENARRALDHGCRLSVNTDAHRAAHFDLLTYGIDQARRAGATAADIINTRPWAELRTLLRRP